MTPPSGYMTPNPYAASESQQPPAPPTMPTPVAPSTVAATQPPPMPYPAYMPPRPTVQPNSCLVPPAIMMQQQAAGASAESAPQQSRSSAPSPCPSQGSSVSGGEDQPADKEQQSIVLPEPETNRKVASRLSNLIAAVSIFWMPSFCTVYYVTKSIKNILQMFAFSFPLLSFFYNLIFWRSRIIHI